MEGQYRFNFEIDSSEEEACCPGEVWRQLPEQRWCCDTIDPIEGASSLYHCFDNPQEACDYLVLWCDQLNTADPFSFSFRIRHGFDPSSQNNWQLAVGASFSDGQETVLGEPHIQSGLVVGVNYTGSDDLVKIWHVDNARVEILLSSDLNYQEMVGTWRAPLFLMEGDGDGNLTLSWSPDPAVEAPLVLGSCRIGEISWGRQVLVRYRYSSARDRALWLDSFMLEGNFEKDSIAPEISSVELVNEKTLRLLFSEKVLLSETSIFILRSETDTAGMSPDSLREFEKGVVLTFPEEIPNRVPHQLQIEGVADLDGNLLEDTHVNVLRNEARWGDVVFNELMTDPDPVVRYSDEYLELFIRTEYPVDLGGWLLKVNDRSYMMNASFVERIEGSEFILIKGVTLPNDGAVISLYSREGALVHAVSYVIPWGEPDWKKEGGWSLESPDADLVCLISNSWIYSEDPWGGTPGQANSIGSDLVDRASPVLLYAGMEERGELLLHYSEPVRLPDDVCASIRLDPGSIVPDSVRIPDPLKDILQLFFPGDFQDLPNFQLSIPGLRDCAGNLSDDKVLRAGALSLASEASVLINEIMYDPEEGMPAFVELYLPGDNILDLRELALHLVEEGAAPDHPLVLSSHSRLFLPGQYLVLTECVSQLEAAYGLEVSGQWVELSGLSGLKGSSGSIYLTDRAGEVIDFASYSDEMHMGLLGDPRGISLERISAMQPGNDPANWHSAASIAGYATPGNVNSQSAPESGTDLILEVIPEVFSPDNDGYEDLLQIIVSTSGNDWVIGLVITDLHGNRIRVLANNHLAGPSVTYTWDGEGENGAMQPMGFYVIHARGYRPATGDQWIRRKAVGLVYR